MGERDCYVFFLVGEIIYNGVKIIGFCFRQ
jgi:hypothetical protein